MEHANGYGLGKTNKQGHTVLHLTLKKAHINNSVIIDYLSTIVDVRTQDLEGDLPLHIAMRHPCYEMEAQMLLCCCHVAEAANTLKVLDAWTPLHRAVLYQKNANLVQATGQIADVSIHSHA